LNERFAPSGAAGHWSYELNRHLGLLSAYKGELAPAPQKPEAQQCARRCALHICG
jgi:hypothetical protein